MELMTNHTGLPFHRAASLIIIAIIILCSSARAGLVEGSVYDFESGEPIANVTIRIEGTGRSMIANENGRYRLRLPPGDYRLKFSHIAYYSAWQNIQVPDSAINLDIRLRPTIIQLKGMKVYDRAYDPGQLIILEAIKRKEEILSKLSRYTFDAYTRFLARNTSEADSVDIDFIAESQVTGFWEKPDKFKQIIRARKQTANIPPEGNLLTVGALLDFNRNRIDFGEYAVVSPTAGDALDYYSYYLIDTLYIDSQAVFRLEIEPKNQIDPLFEGVIDIADSSYEVVGVDLTFNEKFMSNIVKDLRYRQTMVEFEQEYWMPVEIRLEARIDIPLPGLPDYEIEYLAALHNYTFETDHPDGTFNEFFTEVAPQADDIDSASWTAQQMVPLTGEEIDAYQRIDSTVHAPKSILRRSIGILTGAIATTISGYDLFHFNRVEGAYLGLGFSRVDLVSGLTPWLRGGYAFGTEKWQHQYGFLYSLSERYGLRLGAEYQDKIISCPSFFSDSRSNSTFGALVNKTDPLDYYREKGFRLFLSQRILYKTRLTLTYRHYRQTGQENNTEFSLFRDSKKHRPNRQIADGRLRSLQAAFTWDSRPRIKNKGEIVVLSDNTYTILETGVEYTSPDILKSDFDFTRGYFSLKHRRRLLGLGVTSLYLFGGISRGTVPPQRYFTIDALGMMVSPRLAFMTLHETNFGGDRAAGVYLDHDFGTSLFRRTGLPLIKDIPLSLSVHGGLFVTEFENTECPLQGALPYCIDRPYSEIGFGIGRLPLLHARLQFSWQLSDYNTDSFAFDFNIGLFSDD